MVRPLDVAGWIVDAPSRLAGRMVCNAFVTAYDQANRAAILDYAQRLRAIVDHADSEPNRPLILTFPGLPVGRLVLQLAGLVQVRADGWTPWSHLEREDFPRVIQIGAEDFHDVRETPAEGSRGYAPPAAA